jgi:CheY-like chemotaxis protein
VITKNDVKIFKVVTIFLMKYIVGEPKAQIGEVSDVIWLSFEEALKKLFAPFTQADSSTTRKYGGTGLGLSISKLLVEQMGGHIGAISKLGEGSTFWFELNLALGQKPAEILESAQNAAEIGADSRVLLVEDNPVNQAIAKKMLEKLGFRVDVAGNGKEALKAVQERPFEFVLMDCQMPEMDGFEATAEIRSLPSVGGIPIIAMTANAMKGDREKCINAGMDDYISKPMNIKALTVLMQKWVAEVESRKRKAA